VNGNTIDIRLRKQEGDAQRDGYLWTFDNVSKTLKNKRWSNKSLQFSGGWLYIRPTNSRHFQMFRNVNGNIQGIKDKRVMDVSNYQDKEGRRVGFYRRHNKSNQQFDVIYKDEWEEEPKKGELNKDFGLIVGEPFFLMSALRGESQAQLDSGEKASEGRLLDIISRNMVIKTRNGRNTQQWFFDQKSRTIKNLAQPSWSWDIRGSGGSSNMQAWNTNSGWW
jgi:hypothetical protein